LADALARQRELLNARFSDARRACSTLDATAFFEHLTGALDPIVCRVADILPEKAEAVTLALYDLSLELFVGRLLGPEAKSPWIASVWKELLPVAAPLVAREPARLAASASNAIFNLSAMPGTRPRQWLERMNAIAGECPDVNAFLECGKIIAWLAGMAQFRDGALAAAASLAPRLAAGALNLPPETTEDDVTRAIGRLKADPWLTTLAALGKADATPPLRIVAQVGAFRGFGGPFIRPPTVSAAAGVIYVADGEGAWQMTADRYGTAFIRSDSPLIRSASTELTQTVSRRGDVRWGNDQIQLPQLAHASSVAANEHTLTVTLPTSHHVFLLARAAEN
jgi:hypothetical protein